VLNFGIGHVAGAAGSDGPALDRLHRLLEGAGRHAAVPELEGLQAALDQGLHLLFWAMFALAVVTLIVTLIIPARDLASASHPARP
jgi:hypothetical protein